MLQHLPRTRLRELLKYNNPLGSREPRQALRTERLELLLKVVPAVGRVVLGVWVQNHKGHSALAPFRVGTRDDGDFEYVGVFRELLLDGQGGGVLKATDHNRQ